MAGTNRVKKWFMLQVWRLQQVAQILTLALLGVTDSLLLWGKVQWRGGLLANHITGPLILLVIIGGAVWAFAIAWDLWLKMWRDQATVLVEKNPYNKEKFAPKEIVLHGMTWLPVMEKLAQNDPAMQKQVEAFKAWLTTAAREEYGMDDEIKEILRFFGKENEELALQKALK